MHVETANNINTLGRFCGQRDVVSLDRNNLFERFGIEHADVMVLFGGSILAGGFHWPCHYPRARMNMYRENWKIKS